ncbi:hypothetical protein ACN4EE_00620 [Geminocystis sp. CENA526]|uniref:hypothetical protein n=1 Tax=Geminocystis sp. CENA526 TaxID=1355871 RepID=UPI003D6F4603
MIWNFDRALLIQGIDQPKALSYLQELNLDNQDIMAGIGDQYIGEQIENILIFDLVTEAITAYPNIQTSLIFSHPYNVLNAGLEAIEAGIKQLIIYSEKIPPLDLMKLWQQAKNQEVQILGASQGGMLIPEKLCWGVSNADLYTSGSIALINYGDAIISTEIALFLQKHNLGTSIVLNVGNEKFIDIDWDFLLGILRDHESTEVILISINDCSNIDAEKFIKALNQVQNKSIIVYLLDPNNLKFIIQNNSAKIITDQIPQYLNRVLSPQYFQDSLQEQGITVIQDIFEVLPLLKK